MKLRNALLDIAYPPVCEGCGEAYFPGETPYVCDGCLDSKLHRLAPQRCSICGQAYSGRMPPGLRCSNCGNRDLAFDFATSIFQAEGPILDWIHQFKYNRRIHFARTFGALLTKVWQDKRLSPGEEWTVVPVPLHRKRLRQRGFNQSLEIAREWVRRSPSKKKLRILEALKRDVHTRRQATLDRAERLHNLRNAFSPARRAKSLCQGTDHFILVDDVLTTGTTASECALALRKISPNATIAAITVVRG